MKNKLIKYAKEKGIDLEISEKYYDNTEIYVMNDTLKNFQINKVSNYIIKAIKKGKSGEILVTDLSDFDRIIASLNELFTVVDNDNENRLSEGNISNLLREEEKLDYNLVKNDLLALNDLKKKYPDILNIEVIYEHSKNGFYIDNENCKLEDELYYNQFSYSISLKKNDITRVAYGTLYTKKYDINRLREEMEEKINNLIIKIDSESCKTDKYNIILKNDCVASILETFADAFQSKGIYLKDSILTGKINEKVFSDLITIIEDPEHGIASRAFDSEGVKTYVKTIVENGVFKKEINDIEYALKLSQTPTGNAYGVNNLYIKPGDISYDELVKKLDNGIIIDEVYGLHAGINTSSGNISVQAEGLVVQNGKVVKGLNLIILTTNFFELFSNCVAVGNDLSSSLIDVLAPSLLIENITISGKK